MRSLPEFASSINGMQLPDKAMFDHWKETLFDKISESKSSHHNSLGKSVKFRDNKSSSSKMSFKPLFKADWEILSMRTMSENKRVKLKMSIQEAQFYFGILNQKVHKTTNMNQERMRVEKLVKDHRHKGSASPRSEVS
eukprot:CAMPEP_0170509580 /NCGR_PEP_ID=MMETSP0208-20121228/65293_1 /TAXON_ID=197538 /ORGANISM="Strombidium inclinatum, Strain S3" /LENGTH=137 /DNA_ID=CAMNT_0010792953 /DNA_START=870 /DNA_END=1283 /DNA_ORIENTATION=-